MSDCPHYWTVTSECPRCLRAEVDILRKALQPDHVIAFPGGKGTRNMKELTRKAGIELFEV